MPKAALGSKIVREAGEPRCNPPHLRVGRTMKVHGINQQQGALCGQANGELEVDPKKVTCKRCMKVMVTFLLSGGFFTRSIERE